MIKKILPLTFLFVLIPLLADGKSLYVNNSGSPACSDSTTYANNSESNPWCTIGRAAWGSTSRTNPNSSQAAQAGDTIYVTAGTYTTNQPTGDRKSAAYNPVNTGTNGAPIVFEAAGTVYLRQTGGRGPVIGACSQPDCASGYPSNYITWRGFTIDEQYAEYTPDTANAVLWSTTGSTIENCTFLGVGQPTFPGGSYNHSAIRIENATNALIRNNRITNYKSHGAGEWNGNGAGIMVYYGSGLVIENNEIDTCGSGLYIKGGDHTNTTIRKNLIYGNGTGILFQYSGASGINKIYQNIIYSTGMPPGSWGIYVREKANNVLIVNNTVVGCTGGGIGYGNYNPQPSGVIHKNNIVFQTSGSSWNGFGITSLTPVATDRNLYFPTNRFTVMNDYASLTSWRSALGGCPGSDNECNSLVSDPLFVNISQNNYRLQSGSPALTLGRTITEIHGSSGQTIPVGAYITGEDIIGRTAGSSPPGPPPAPPIGFSIQ